MNVHVIKAIFKRNFVSYFSNPTGYVFICVFVFLSSVAAFWPNDFFNSNLANLDQLTKYLPIIMLVFIPAITMGIWADERRQGTDELLLTIPATDFDVVIGKYLAAVAIFTVSLLFSLCSNLVVLWTLGSPDLGLFIGTYFGYWMVGLAMLAVGMVASFLTGNLPIAFILGALFNAPLVLAGSADAVPWPQWLIEKAPDLVMKIKSLSFGEQLRDFSRGVLSLSGITYFLTVTALMLYVSMVLIGRRHWRGGAEGARLAGHYWLRFLALVIVVVGVNVFFSRHDRLRADITTEGLSSLAPQTRLLLKDLDPKHTIRIQAFISKTVPEAYVPTRLNLISALREFEALGGDKIKVDINSDMEMYTDEAQRAETQFGIHPQTVLTRSRGAQKQDQIFLGAVVSSGLEKQVIPFFDIGLPVEYELIRSVSVVAQLKQKKVGVIGTDVKLFGGFDFATRSMNNSQLIIDELKKQYEVVQVDATQPITEKYDVLMAVQPSTLDPQQMDNFLAAVRSGQPTAIFEDPMPIFDQHVAGTMAPRQPPGNDMMMMQRGPLPKGDINKLWDLLQVKFRGESVVWQEFNPYPKNRDPLGINRLWIFVDKAEGNAEAFNSASRISEGLQQVLFLFAGSVTEDRPEKSPLKFTRLAITGSNTGTAVCDELIERSFFGARLNMSPQVMHPTGDKYVMAAHIQGKLKVKNLPMSDKEPEASDEEGPPPRTAPTDPRAKSANKVLQDILGAAAGKTSAAENNLDGEVNVVLVADIDCLYPAFFQLRNMAEDSNQDLQKMTLDNIPFVLNILDVLASDNRFVEIRTRRQAHRTLETIEAATSDWREENNKATEKMSNQMLGAIEKLKKSWSDKIAEIEGNTELNNRDKSQRIEMLEQERDQKLKSELDRRQRDRDQSIAKADRDLMTKIRQQQDSYKLKAVLLPPIPPLLVAFLVYFNRRAREREGVAKSRLK